MKDFNRTCIVCQKDENEVPLVVLAYKGVELRICPQHLPILIHEPQKLAGIIDGAEHFTAG